MLEFFLFVFDSFTKYKDFPSHSMCSKCSDHTNQQEIPFVFQDGYTDLHHAAQWGYKDIARMLLDHGADIHIVAVVNSICRGLILNFISSQSSFWSPKL